MAKRLRVLVNQVRMEIELDGPFKELTLDRNIYATVEAAIPR